jgi:hypothetical protein
MVHVSLHCPFCGSDDVGKNGHSNEVRRRWGDKKESLWIGHSEEVVKKHYLKFSDEEFAEAAGE